MERLNGGLKDIFSTILKDHTAEGSKLLQPIIILHGNGNVLAPGGTVHVHQLPNGSGDARRREAGMSRRSKEDQTQ